MMESKDIQDWVDRNRRRTLNSTKAFRELSIDCIEEKKFDRSDYNIRKTEGVGISKKALIKRDLSSHVGFIQDLDIEDRERNWRDFNEG